MTTSKSNNLTTSEILPGFRLEWIQTGSMLGIQNGKAYFSFDVKHESRIDSMDVKIIGHDDTISVDSKLVGCHYSSNGMSIMLGQISGRARALAPLFWLEPQVQLTNVSQPFTVQYHYEKTNDTEEALTQMIDRNGISFGTSTEPPKGWIDNIKIWKFSVGGIYDTDHIVPATSGRIHEIVIEMNGKLMHQLIPFQHKNGQVGMLDLADMLFYKSESGTEFYPGPRL